MASVALAAGDNRDDGQRRDFSVRLHGFQVVPAISTTGHGTLDLSIAKDEASIAYTLSYAALEGTLTAASHIHLGQSGVNGGVSAFLCGGPKPACPAITGTVSGVITAADVVGPAFQGIAAGELAELIHAIRAGVTYASVHTNKHPGSELLYRPRFPGH
jgi:hypothetical protein